MHILFLTKRTPQGRDLVSRPYGRFHNIPLELSRSGCRVTQVFIDYGRSQTEITETDGIRKICISVSHPIDLVSGIKREMANCRVDVVVGFSDMLVGILGAAVARIFGAAYTIDAYDNYASYLPYAYPVHMAWKNVIRRAQGATVAGPQLQNLFQQYGRKGPVALVPMAADSAFQPLDRIQARQQLDLHGEERLVGYCGELTSRKGLSLFRKLLLAGESHASLRFVLTGRTRKGPEGHENLLQTGYLSDHQMPVLVNALDIVLSVNLDNSFGRYSYPAKISEAKACGVRVLATNLPNTSWMLANDPQFLFSEKEIGELPGRMMCYSREKVSYQHVETWDRSAAIFGAELERALRESRV